VRAIPPISAICAGAFSRVEGRSDSRLGCELRYEWGEAMDMVTSNGPMAAAFGDNARRSGEALGPRRAGETSGSTDMGNISSVIPSIHPFLSVSADRVPWHSREFARAAPDAAGARNDAPCREGARVHGDRPARAS
jgi:metal-dependent amidase/aminoacylase/carboxypeptidase family protein